MNKLLILLIIATLFLNGVGVTEAGSSSRWEKRSEPVFSGDLIASDPAILRDGAIYRMFYTCWIPGEDHFRSAICQATSADGFAWTNIPTDGSIAGLVLRGRDGEWDEHLEASFVVKHESEYLLYYSGYGNEGVPAMGYPAALAVAKSTDGVNFERVEDGPIIQPTPGWLDNDAVYSPTIYEEDGQLVMIYAGHCYTTCNAGYGVNLLGARSNDGVHWIKETQPVLQAIDGLEWTRDGVAEPGIVIGPDGFLYLFFTGLLDEQRAIGVARGESLLGPWDVIPDPIIVPSPNGFDAGGALAPDVHIEGNLARMWFLGFDTAGDIAIGYAETIWPFWENAG
ncbi:MAG: hypothetical protein ACRDHN_10405 [Thermomicrobiales bacterium]